MSVDWKGESAGEVVLLRIYFNRKFSLDNCCKVKIFSFPDAADVKLMSISSIKTKVHSFPRRFTLSCVHKMTTGHT